MNLNEIAEEIRVLLENRRQELKLTFREEDHIYHMMDLDGNIRNDFPSVSKVVKKFYPPFDDVGKAFEKSGGDPVIQQQILEEWRLSGEYATNMGSRVHFFLETHLVDLYKKYKTVREPIFSCDEHQIKKSDAMIDAGKKYLELMHERGAVLLDTEAVLGDNELKYTGQPDKTWLIKNKNGDDFGFIITDWKSNQPKNFEVQWYTKKMYHPFQNYPNTALSHYYLQLPLYGRLLLKMLSNTKYADKKLLGCVIVLLKADGSFEEFKVPPEINQTILTMNLNKYINDKTSIPY